MSGVQDYLEIQEMLKLSNLEELAEVNTSILMALHWDRQGDPTRLKELGWTRSVGEAAARMVAREKIARGLPLLPAEEHLMGKGVVKGLGVIFVILGAVVGIGLLIVGAAS